MPWYCATCGELAETPGGCPRDGSQLLASAGLDLVGHPIGELTAIGRLGGGSYASVYLAIHRRSLARFAVKLVRASLGSSEAARIVVEARAAAAISHPNVVRVFDIGVDAHGRPFLVMELLAGRPLRELWPRRPTLAELLPIADGVLAGVAAAHRLGIVHRDLKPENVVVTADRGPVVVDFGVAKLLADPASLALTMTGERLGTPRYMAPEQITGAPVDARADVYALGVWLYEALAGEPPFPGDAVFALYHAHISAAPAPLAPRGVPPRIAAEIERALAKDPARRHRDAGELRAALTRAADPRRSHRRVTTAAAAALALAIVGVGAAARLTEPAAPPAAPPPSGEPVAYVLPPADVALDPNLERALASSAQYLGRMPHDTRVQALCPMWRLARKRIPDAKIQSFYERYTLLLLEGLPGEDPARLCAKP